ncbi:MAG TPA: aminotransferase class IV, partial [Steroidobacteraceae bacterium]|nr:aminotransferase class IV [Steroidobacteraceae bacterium]
PPEPAAPRRILSIDETPVMNDGAPITVRWCSTQLGRNPGLAGIKHLNRLEQVLARAEWSDVSIAEGLMLDTEGEIVCGTSCNVFAVIDGSLTTPDLRYCGVAGVMRRQVLSVAAALGIAVNEAPLRPDELARASEVFVTNAIAGIRPVGRLAELEWPIGATTRRLARALELW